MKETWLTLTLLGLSSLSIVACESDPADGAPEESRTSSPRADAGPQNGPGEPSGSDDDDADDDDADDDDADNDDADDDDQARAADAGPDADAASPAPNAQGQDENPEPAPDGETDPYCPHAWNGFAELDRFVELTNELSAEPDVPASKLQENGALAVQSAEEMDRHFSRAQEFVVETEVDEAFDALLLYQEVWMLPQAQLAAAATDSMSYQQASLQLLLGDGVAEAVAQGALASGTISSYTLERCGATRQP